MEKVLTNNSKVEPEFPNRVEVQPWMILGEQKGVVIEVTDNKGREWLNWSRQDLKWDYLRKKGRQLSLGYTPKIVLVFGASGSGKDVVTDEIEKQLKGKISHVSADWYYGPFGKINDRYVFGNNYDHPNAVDWDLLRLHLSWLRQGFEVRAPVYDFTTHFRKEGEDKKLMPKEIILVSGIMVGHALGEVVDLVIGVETSWSECVRRRVKRDIEERGRSEKGSLKQIEATVKPGYEKFVKPYLSTEWWREKQKEMMLVNNERNAPAGSEPARVESGQYIERLKKILVHLI